MIQGRKESKQMTKRILGLAIGVMIIGSVISSEPYYIAVAVTDTVQSNALPRFTQTVRIVSDGADTCFFRLFTDVDTTGNAAITSAPIHSGESLGFMLLPAASPTTEHPSGVRDSESFSAAGARARYYKSLSAVCDTGDTATWRIYSK